MIEEEVKQGKQGWVPHESVWVLGFCSSRPQHIVREWLAARNLWPRLVVATQTLPTPLFFVGVASTRLRYCASSLFATHRRGLRSVASKGLGLHKNCAILTLGGKGMRIAARLRNRRRMYPRDIIEQRYDLARPICECFIETARMTNRRKAQSYP